MTIQISEKLLYQGLELVMTARPLSGYLAFHNEPTKFSIQMSCLRRGYVGTWTIKAQRLFLTALDGTLADGSKASLVSLFPDYPNGVFAHWYSGRAQCPQGKFLRSGHEGDAIQYESDLFLDFDHGVLLRSQVVHNGAAAQGETRTAGCIPAATIFGAH